jgi:hypothetical protein
MRWFPVLTIPAALCLAVFAAAEDAAGLQTAAPGNLLRNRALIEELVVGGLRLAGEDDALHRADRCRDLAERLADELRQAAADRESDRAAELGEHLGALLRHGVAGNLRTVRRESSPSSTREIELQRVGGQVRDLVAMLEESLRGEQPTAGDLRRVLRGVREAGAEVEKLLKVPAQP